MKKVLKIFLIILAIIILLGIVGIWWIYNSIFGTISIDLKNLNSTEIEEISKIIGLNNINANLKLEKIKFPKVYKDIYYAIYFSTDINNIEDILKNNKADDIYRDITVIEKKENNIKYCCIISSEKYLDVLEQIINKYNK